MKTLLKYTSLVVVILCLMVATFLVMFGAPRTQAQEPEQVAILPGDLNCDGGVDLSDAINLLAYLFADGEPPVVCAQTTDPLPALTKEDLVEALVEARNVFEPRAWDLVTLTGDISTGNTIYTVPEGKWLIITDYRYGDSEPGLRMVDPDGSVTQLIGTYVLPNSSAFLDVSISTGIAVPPEHELELNGPMSGAYFINGYLVDDEEETK